MRLVAVFSGGPPSNEVFLPSGNYGEAFIVAGNAGIVGTTQDRWGATRPDLRTFLRFDIRYGHYDPV